MILLTYDQFTTSDLQGETLADYLVSVEADLNISDRGRLVYAERSFPVAELARELSAWLDHEDHEDFVFNSLSFAGPGAVLIQHGETGWRFSSSFTPDVTSEEYDWTDVRACVLEFVDRVRADLLEVGIDGRLILG